MFVVKERVPAPLKDAVKASVRLCRRASLHWANRPSFHCPVCGYVGKFLNDDAAYGQRVNAICPSCGAYERHRLQRLVLDQLFADWNPAGRSALHIAPERIMRPYLAAKFAVYHTADINPRGVDFQADLCALPFADQSYDFVYASHVLEHIKDDRRALAEIARILRPDGIAVLPVPVLGARTVEYPEPSPAEDFHVRAPGSDYFDRYRSFFTEVTVKTSEDFPAEHQVHLFEDRLSFSPKRFPNRPRVIGDCHLDYVPICRAGAE